MPCGDDWPDRTAPVLVFDLDGTILRVNSFPCWALYLIAGPIRGIGGSGRVRLALRASWLLLLRKLRLIDHAALLGGLQRAWRAMPSPTAAAVANPFQTMLLGRLRANLRPLLEMVASGRVDAVLATAAAGEYAIGLGRRLGFRHVLATPPARAHGEPINRGARKRDALLALLENAGWRGRPLILLTDHIDDLPLMRLSSAVCWFGRTGRVQEACDAADDVSFLLCRNLGARQILAAVEAFGVFARAPLNIIHATAPRSALTAS